MLNAEKNAVGRTSPAKLFSRPRSFTSTKFGSRVSTGGTISAVSRIENTTLRPRQCSRANAYAAIAEKNTVHTVRTDA